MRIFKKVMFFVVMYLVLEEVGFSVASVDQITNSVGSSIVSTVKSGMNFVVPVAGVFGGAYVGIKFLNGEQDAGKHLMMFAVGYALLWGISSLI